MHCYSPATYFPHALFGPSFRDYSLILMSYRLLVIRSCPLTIPSERAHSRTCICSLPTSHRRPCLNHNFIMDQDSRIVTDDGDDNYDHDADPFSLLVDSRLHTQPQVGQQLIPYFNGGRLHRQLTQPGHFALPPEQTAVIDRGIHTQRQSDQQFSPDLTSVRHYRQDPHPKTDRFALPLEQGPVVDRTLHTQPQTNQQNVFDFIPTKRPDQLFTSDINTAHRQASWSDMQFNPTMNSPHNQQPTRQMTNWLNEPVDQPPTRPIQCLPSPTGEPPRTDTPLRYPDFAGFRKDKSSISGTRPRAGLKTRSVTQPRLDSEGRIWKYNSTPWSAYEHEVLRQAAARGTSWYATMTYSRAESIPLH
jgi:hypothetical protein